MVHGARLKKIAIIAGALLLLMVVAVAAWFRPAPARVDLMPISSRPASIQDVQMFRETVGPLQTETNASRLKTVMIAGGDPLKDPSSFVLFPEYTVRVGGHWASAQGVLFPDKGEWRGRFKDCVVCLVPTNAEACRLHVMYFSALPLGLGSPVARLSPPSKASAWMQKAVQALSQPLYDRLWPRNAGWKLSYKKSFVEVPLPQHDIEDKSLFPDF